jgi:hypothetical protein
MRKRVWVQALNHDYIGGQFKPFRNGATMTHYSYQGPLGEISYNRWYYFAWQESHLIGTFKTFEEAMGSLVWKERLKTKVRDG